MFLLFILFVIIAPQCSAAVQCSDIKTAYRNACDCSVDSKFTGDLMIFKPDDCEAVSTVLSPINLKEFMYPPNYLTVVGDTLYFTALNGSNGYELWKSDGTKDGTEMVKNINPSGNSVPGELIVYKNTLYFSAGDGSNGRELWKSDGTEDGTVMVKNIHSGGSDSSPRRFIVYKNTLYFSAVDGSNGRELWKSDGTKDGTVMVKDTVSSGSSDLWRFIAVGDTLYFSAGDGSNGFELWKSDGTEAGTKMVEYIGSQYTDDDRPLFYELITIGDTLYYGGYVNSKGELWTIKTEDVRSDKVMCSVNE